MSMKSRHPKRTLCEVLRLINDIVQSDSEEHRQIRDLLAEAEHKAKRVVRKLVEYNQKEHAEWWEENQDFKAHVERELRTYKIGKYKSEDDGNNS